MNTTTHDLPVEVNLERELERIEVQLHDAHIRKIITERLAQADDATTKFIPHDDVVRAYRSRLMTKLTGR
jgi:hypothetical protein